MDFLRKKEVVQAFGSLTRCGNAIEAFFRAESNYHDRVKEKLKKMMKTLQETNTRNAALRDKLSEIEEQNQAEIEKRERNAILLEQCLAELKEYKAKPRKLVKKRECFITRDEIEKIRSTESAGMQANKFYTFCLQLFSEISSYESTLRKLKAQKVSAEEKVSRLQVELGFYKKYSSKKRKCDQIACGEPRAAPTPFELE